MRVDPKLISEGLLDSEAASLQQCCPRVVGTSSANVISLEHAMLNHLAPFKDSGSTTARSTLHSSLETDFARDPSIISLVL